MASDLLLSEGASACKNSATWFAAHFPGPAQAIIATRHLQCAFAGYARSCPGGTIGYRCILYNTDFALPPGPEPLSQPEKSASATVLIAGSLCGSITSLPGLAFKPSSFAAPLGPAIELLPSLELESVLRQLAASAPHKTRRPLKSIHRAASQWAASSSSLAKNTAQIMRQKMAQTTFTTTVKTAFAKRQRTIALAAAALCVVVLVVSIGVFTTRHDTPAKPEDPAATYVAAPSPSAGSTSVPAPVPTSAPPQPSSAPKVPPTSVPVVSPPRPAPPTQTVKLKSSLEKQKKPETTRPVPADRNPAPHGPVTFEPSEIPALNSKADKANGDGDYDRAIQLYGVVLRNDPGNAEAKRGLEKARRNKASK